MNKCYKYEDDNYEILVEKQIFIKDKKANDYYKSNISNLNENIIEKLVEYKSKVSLTHYFLFWVSFISLFFLNIILIKKMFKNHPLFEHNIYNYIFFALYLLINIFIHEIGHIKSMHLFEKRYNKIGFKMNYYVFPSIFVQINDIYLLTKREKIIVHCSGLLLNLFIIDTIQIVNIFFWDNYILSYSFLFFSYALFWNIVPVLNSDGYKILLVLLNMDELEIAKRNHWFIKITQIIGLILAIRAILLWFI